MSGARSGRRRALVLTYLFRPEPNFITADIADLLASAMDVVVIAPFPSYPVGRFYPGFRAWWPSRTVEGGVTVWRLPHIPDRSRSTLRRGISYLSFTLLATLWAPFVAGRPALVYVYQTPFTTALAALFFKWAYGARLFYSCADLWPESFTASGVAKPGRLMTALFAYRRWINRQADHLVCSTRGTLEQFAAEGVPRDRLHLVPVWVDGVPGSAPPVTDGASRTIVYAGNLGPAQALDTLVRAAAILQREEVPVTFMLYGTGSMEGTLRAMVRDGGLTNVAFGGRVGPDVAFRHSAEAMGQVVSLRRTDLFRMTVPSKLLFCFAAGAPILAGLEGEGADLAGRSGGAILYDAEDPASMADAVRRLVATPAAARIGMRGALQRFHREHFTRDRLLDAYRAIFWPAPGGEAAPAPREPAAPGHGLSIHAGVDA